MKQKITAGAELDLLTREELAATLEGIVSGYLRPTMPRRDEDGLVVASGADVTITLPPAPRGMEVIYTRVVLDAPGSAFTPGAPYNAPASYIGLYRDLELIDFVSNVAGAGGGIPYRWTFSTSNGIRLRDGEALSAIVHVPPAVGTGLVLRADGYLSPISEREPGSLLLPGDGG